MSDRLSPRAKPALAGAWLVLIALALLAPALVHGPYLGPYALLANNGLLRGSVHGMAIQIDRASSDVINEMIPWTIQVWQQVHQGHLPLWNNDSALGMPLAFNWQSAPLSLPSLVGYLVPAAWAYTVGVMVTLVIAGSGATALGRLLSLGWLGSVAAGTFFELSGTFVDFLGYPYGQVLAWTGWLLAAIVLVVRSGRRTRAVTVLAVAIAFALLAGNPEAVIVLLLTGLVFGSVFVAGEVRSWPELGRIGMDLVLACAAGVALAAPIVLPGIQLTGSTLRTSLGGSASLTVGWFSGLVLPAARSGAFSAYLLRVQGFFGVIGVVLAIVGVGLRWRRRGVLAALALTVVGACLIASHAVLRVLAALPIFHLVYWSRSMNLLGMGLAVLCGVGLDAVVRGTDQRATARWLAGGTAVAAVYVVYSVWLATAHPGTSAMWWPCLSLLLLFLVAAALFWTRAGDQRQQPRLQPIRTLCALLLLAVATVFLVTQGSTLLTSGRSAVPTTSAITDLKRAVGAHTVGFASGNCLFNPVVGLPPEFNVAYSLDEFAIYDPVIPKEYFSAWRAATGTSGGVPTLATFCPTITTAASAREFGVTYLLTTHSQPLVPGTIKVATIADQDLSRVPHSGLAVVATSPTDPGRVVPVVAANPSTWKLTTSASGPRILRLHLTDVPGWRATIDGMPLSLHRLDGIMLQAHLPPGRHVIVVTYWPSTFTTGLGLAGAALLVLISASVVAYRRRPEGSYQPAPPTPA